MKNKFLIAVISIFIVSAFVACGKDDLCPTPVSGPVVITSQSPMNSPQCCSHRHFTSTGFWYYCCRCGILHAGGSGVGGAFYPGDVLVGAQVDYIAEDETIVATVYTDAEGHWPQEDIPDGYYTVRFTLDGYTTTSVEDVEMNDGQTESDMTVAMYPE